MNDEDDDDESEEDDEGDLDETEEEVEILVSFEEDGREYHLVRLLDPVLLVGKVRAWFLFTCIPFSRWPWNSLIGSKYKIFFVIHKVRISN